MTKSAAITSMDQKYYDRCGYQFLNSYDPYMKGEIPLYLYNEDNFIPLINEINLMGWNLGNDYENFISRHSNNRVITFAKKAYSIIHAMENIECDKLIWFDSDCVIKKPLDKNLLAEIGPNNCVSTHFSVWHRKDGIEYHSCETGFFILNKTTPGFTLFKEVYKDIYNSDNTEGLRRFYDGDVYGKTVDIVESKGYRTLNLNPSRHSRTPIPRSRIKSYIEHHKAGVKDRIKNEI